MILEKVRKKIARELAKSLDVEEEVALNSLERSKHAHLYSNIAFTLAKDRKVQPIEIAKKVDIELAEVEEFKAVGPYLNFNLSDLYFSEVLKIVDENYGKGDGGERVIVEFPSVNPNKPWHIGHLRNALLGDSVARILEFRNYNVERIDYIDDLGLQVAESIYLYLKTKEKPNKKFDHWAGEQYVKVHKMAEENPEVEKEIREVLKKMEEGNNEIAEKAREFAEEVVKAQYQTNEKLGIVHDALIFESDVIKTIFREGIEKLKESGILKFEEEGKNKGCWVIEVEELDAKDKQKVVIRSDGTTTYTGKDIIFHLWKVGLIKSDFKYKEFIRQVNGKMSYKTSQKGEEKKFGGVEKVINVVGVEQKHPQKVVEYVVRKLSKGKKKILHLAYEHTTLPKEKFSGRKGTWIGYTADEFIDEAIKRAKEKMGGKEDEEISRKIGLGAIKFSFLRVAPEKKIVFEWNRALSLEGDSGPYLQYAYVRMLGILRKAEEKAEEVGVRELKNFNEEEKQLILHLDEFERVVAKSAEELRPNYIADYVLELASLFNQFYTKHPVLKAEEKERGKRLLIVKKSAEILKNALFLLGIEVPERM